MPDTAETIAADCLLTPCFAGYLQIDVKLGDVAANLHQVEKALHRLAPPAPGIVVLPELWAAGFDYANLKELAGRTPALLAALKELAARYQIHLAGSLPEAVTGAGGEPAFRNTMFITGPHGTIGGRPKQHLFGPILEDRHFAAGNAARPVVSPLGRLATLVCYDLRFPEAARAQAAQGAGLLLVAAQWPLARKAHWRTLLKARAIENQIFVVAANCCGSTADLIYAGHSLIIAPDGSVLAEAGAGPAEGGVHLDPALLAASRARFNTVAARPYPRHDRDKIVSRRQIGEIARRAQALGQKVVFTNGCFDILHAGHATYLEAARQAGDCLIVGLNSDASVKSLQGPDRPCNRQEDRARLLAGLGCVDFVVLFEEDTADQLIGAIKPDILAQGADWPDEQIIGAREVKANGGRILRIPQEEGGLHHGAD